MKALVVYEVADDGSVTVPLDAHEQIANDLLLAAAAPNCMVCGRPFLEHDRRLAGQPCPESDGLGCYRGRGI